MNALVIGFEVAVIVASLIYIIKITKELWEGVKWLLHTHKTDTLEGLN